MGDRGDTTRRRVSFRSEVQEQEVVAFAGDRTSNIDERPGVGKASGYPRRCALSRSRRPAAEDPEKNPRYARRSSGGMAGEFPYLYDLDTGRRGVARLGALAHRTPQCGARDY